MWGAERVLEVLTGSGIEEGLRFAYAASRFLPAGLVVGSAAVLAGLIGATAMRKARATRLPITSAPSASVPWVLGVALVASWLVAAPVPAAVLCRKGESARLVLRPEACRPHERVLRASDLEIDQGPTCLETIALAWREVEALRRQLEATLDLAARVARQPWAGADTWFALQAVGIVDSLRHLEHLAAEMGLANAAEPIGQMRRLVSEEWSHPADACVAALGVLPALEAALPIPPAS